MDSGYTLSNHKKKRRKKKDEKDLKDSKDLKVSRIIINIQTFLFLVILFFFSGIIIDVVIVRFSKNRL